MKKILITLGLFLSLSLFAQTNYYLDATNGDDGAAGTIGAPWQTISKINSSSFSGGDTIFFKRGERWFETLTVPSSGTTGSPIVHSAYGTGENPLFYSGSNVGSWSLDHAKGEGGIWVADRGQYVADWGDDGGYHFYTGTDTINGLYAESFDTTNLTQEFEYAWINPGDPANGELYIYSPSDPNILYDSIIRDSLSNAILLNNKEHLVFENLSFLHYRVTAFRDTYPATTQLDGLEIKNCYIGFMGMPNSAFSVGMSVWHSNMYLHNNFITAMGRRGLSINMDGSSTIFMDSVYIYDNYFSRGFHTTGTDIALAGAATFTDIFVYNNIIDDSQNDYTLYDGSVGLYTEGNGTGYFSNYYVYNNVIIENSGIGIDVQGVDTAYIDHNSFYGKNPGITYSGGYMFITGGSTQIYMRNNAIYNNATTTDHPSYFFNTGASVEIQQSDYNLLYASNAPTYLVNDFGGNGTYITSEWSDYVSEFGQDANSVTPTDPLYTSTSEPYDLRPQEGSPLIEAATPIAWITVDKDGNARDETTPTIGAYEDTAVPSSEKDILTFTLPEQTVAATINDITFTVAIIVAYGTDISALTPTITVSTGATIAPLSGTEQNFSSPFEYTVTAEDLSTQVWTVTVTVASAPTTTTISFNGALRLDGKTVVW